MASRPYISAVREDSASRTRTAVLDSAERLFSARGYGRTRLAEIAADARVAVNTVYTSVGGKKELVHAIVERFVDHEVVLTALTGMDAATTTDELLRVLVRGIRRSYEVTLRPALVVIDAARVDGALESDYHAMTDPFVRRLQAFAERCTDLHPRRHEIDPRAVSDVFWFFLGYSAWKTMQDLGWSWDAREAWTLRRLQEAVADLAV
jgi:AcrR family transcriptional regulator